MTNLQVQSDVDSLGTLAIAFIFPNSLGQITVFIGSRNKAMVTQSLRRSGSIRINISTGYFLILNDPRINTSLLNFHFGQEGSGAGGYDMTVSVTQNTTQTLLNILRAWTMSY